MAETDNSERTEEPSQRRLQQARERGFVPRSRELTNFASLIAGSVALAVTGAALARAMSTMMRTSLQFDASRLDDSDGLGAALAGASFLAAQVLLPLFASLVAIAILASIALGGWNVSAKALMPDFSRLSPGAGLKRIFGLQGFSELAKALLKCVVVGGVGFAVVAFVFGRVAALTQMEPAVAVGAAARLMTQAFVGLCAALAVIAAVDIPLQLHQYKRSLRMTRQELREELKETDGRPEVKSRIRQLQQQMARRRMMQQVPRADVVIVNPTHFAVALKYDMLKMRAPKVLAKGVDLIAQNIRRVAAEHQVPVFEAPKLARALYRSTDLNAEIPAGLYAAVAQVLSYIFRVRAMNPTLAARIARPVPQVADEFDVE